MSLFVPTNILIPKVAEPEKWSVIACDQFTSQPEYWERVKNYVGDAPSSLKLIYPEAKLSDREPDQSAIAAIRSEMKAYLESDLFTEYENAFVYTERTLSDGTVRKGIVGAMDLDGYSYEAGSVSEIRPTEKTILERIPPRKKIREQAQMEIPHILMFADDEKNLLWEFLEQKKDSFPILYDFDLMEQGGHLMGRLVSGKDAEALQRKIENYEVQIYKKYEALNCSPILYAAADGNHSLAAAKAYAVKKQKEAGGSKKSLEHYAMVELVNLYAESQKFEPIHRIIKNTNPQELLNALKAFAGAEQGIPLKWHRGNEEGLLFLNLEKGTLAAGILQEFLDRYLAVHAGVVDYIHGTETLMELSKKEGCIGFELPGIKKDRFFQEISENGVFPRKTFSVGHASDKRYYLEARKLV